MLPGIRSEHREIQRDPVIFSRAAGAGSMKRDRQYAGCILTCSTRSLMKRGMSTGARSADLTGTENYHTSIAGEDALRIAIETRIFEDAALAHEIAFLEYTGRYFLEHGLRHVRKKGR